MPRYTDLSHKVFGRLTVLEYIGVKHDSANWKCGCRCGKYCEATIGDLNRKDRPKRSCGKCYADHKYPSEWVTWRNINQRCYNENSDDYKNYGGRGITVCLRWRQDFFNFLEDVGLKEDKDLTIERLANDGNYEPDNCIWATRFVQAKNKRNTL